MIRVFHLREPITEIRDDAVRIPLDALRLFGRRANILLNCFFVAVIIAAISARAAYRWSKRAKGFRA